jgi:hypothetical protein
VLAGDAVTANKKVLQPHSTKQSDIWVLSFLLLWGWVFREVRLLPLVNTELHYLPKMGAMAAMKEHSGFDQHFKDLLRLSPSGAHLLFLPGKKVSCYMCLGTCFPGRCRRRGWTVIIPERVVKKNNKNNKQLTLNEHFLCGKLCYCGRLSIHF